MALSVVELASMPDIKEYKTLQDAVADSRVPYTLYWVRRLCQEGKITAIKLGTSTRGTWLVHMPSLLNYIKNMDELGEQKHNPWD